MSLHDVDVNNSNRDRPSTNGKDDIADGQRMAHQTASSHYKPSGDPSTGRLQQIGKTFIANDGSTNKAIFGYNSALNLWGMFVAKDGVDVMTNTDLNQFILNSSQDTFKIVRTDTATLVRSANTQTGVVTIPHGLSITPIAICYALIGGAYLPLPWTSTVPLGTGYLGVDKDMGFSVDATNLTLFTDVDAGGLWYATKETFSIRYYLLQETAA